ncbi:MAG: hypothetical protein Q9214_002566 [Letrouitia sp. 1 TL-2023]
MWSVKLTLSIFLTAFIIDFLLKAFCFSPLKSFKGPFIARYTNLWKLVVNYQGNGNKIQRELHGVHGSAVRIGPNHISLDEPSLIKTIYSPTGDYVKVARCGPHEDTIFEALLTRCFDVEIIFSTQNEALNSLMKRPIGKFYSLTYTLGLEPILDDCIKLLLGRLEQEFCGVNDKKVCDMDEWTHYCTFFYASSCASLHSDLSQVGWDAMYMMNFSCPMGFLERGSDVEGAMKDTARASDRFSWAGHISSIDKLLKYFGRPAFLSMAKASMKQIMLRKAETQSTRLRPDFLDSFHNIQRADPDGIEDDMVLNWVVNNIGASVNSVAATVDAIIYYVLKDPSVHARLRNEIDSLKGKIPISWKAINKLPYFDAVVQEALRLHPPAGFSLDRVVPKEGLSLPDGRFLPGGTIVGMNPWVTNRNKRIYGSDADSFNPSRWLRGQGEDEFAFQTRIGQMKNTSLSFGGGKRVCMGKSLGLMETSKVAASLFARFDMELVDPKRDWKIFDTLFVRISGFEVFLKKKGVENGA